MSLRRTLVASIACLAASAAGANSFLYVSQFALDSANNGIYVYAINPFTGVLALVPGANHLHGDIISIVAAPDGAYVHGIRYEKRLVGDSTIVTAALDSGSGALSAASTASGTGLAGGLAVTRDGNFLYELTFSSGVTAFSVNRGTGALTPVSGSPFGAGAGIGGIAITASGTRAYAVSYSSSQVLGFSINASGQLIPLAGSPTTLPQVPSHAVVNAAGSVLYVSYDRGVLAYAIDPATGNLTAIGTFPGGGPILGTTSMIVHPGGQFLYLMDWSHNLFVVYAINPATGALTLTGAPASTPGPGLFEESGMFTYTTDGTNVYGFAVNPVNGSLTPLAGSPFAGGPDSALSLAIVSRKCSIDIDGNRSLDALTDGLLLLRAMFGLTGSTAISGAVAPNGSRNTWAHVRSFLNTNCGATFGP